MWSGSHDHLDMVRTCFVSVFLVVSTFFIVGSGVEVCRVKVELLTYRGRHGSILVMEVWGGWLSKGHALIICSIWSDPQILLPDRFRTMEVWPLRREYVYW